MKAPISLLSEIKSIDGWRQIDRKRLKERKKKKLKQKKTRQSNKPANHKGYHV